MSWNKYDVGGLLFIVLPMALLVGAAIYFLKVKPTMNFCDRYFKDVPTVDCVLSDRYRVLP